MKIPFLCLYIIQLMAGPDRQYPVIGHHHIISCIPPLITNPNSMVVHVILVTALVQKIGLGFLETDSELSH